MINQVDIASFGSFQALDWKKTVKDRGKTTQYFKRLNVLYGRNYSGKTTLSRVFRSLETRKLPPNYVGSAFTLTGDNGAVAHTDLLAHNYDVRVYNRDFVTDNLSFLVNQDASGVITRHHRDSGCRSQVGVLDRHSRTVTVQDDHA